MYQRSDETTKPKISTNMVNLSPKNSPASEATAPAINDNNYNDSNSNGNPNTVINNNNIIDSVSASNSNNLVKINQISNENRNQNVNAIAKVENYRPTYGAYLTNILPRGPYLQYKFNDHQHQQHQQQQPIIKSHFNENDNNEHLNHHQHLNHFTHHEHQQVQVNPINHHRDHQLEAVPVSKDFRSLPHAANANPVIGNNPLSNYHHSYHNQCPSVALGPSGGNMASVAPGSVGNLVSKSTTFGSSAASPTHNIYSSQHYMTNANVNADQWNPIYHPEQSRSAKTSSNPSLQNTNSASGPGSAYPIACNVNRPEISAASNGYHAKGKADKLLPAKGYQTLPHKLRSGQGGSGGGGSRDTNYILQRNLHEDIKSNQMHVKTYSAVPSGSSGSSDFLQQIKQKNSNMLARMSATLAKNYGRALSQQEIRYPLTGRVNSEPGGMSTQFSRSTNALTSQTNCVTLDDVIRLKPGGLSEYEGWALLCQAVQALQDLFLTDTPSTLRILPLVRPSTIQITSRGRVVFIVTTTLGTASLGQLDKFNDVDASPCHDITAHLAPEFLSTIDKKVAFAESDIEKMWIYSLGITLRKIIRGQQNRKGEPGALSYDNGSETAINSKIMSIARSTYQNHGHCNQCEVKENGLTNNSESGNSAASLNPYCTYNSYQCALDISLDQVLGCMCERNLHQRASLMYLLDVISTFCRNQQQVKPFSHIVMELFADVTAAPERDNEDLAKHTLKPVAAPADGSRSETDSGRSSAHGDKDSDCYGQYDCQNQALQTADLNYDQMNQQNLRVIRNRPTENTEYQKFGTIGYAGVKTLLMQKKEGVRAPALQVVRRNKEGVLRRRNSFRRNTIDINLFDLEKARQENFQMEEKNDLNKSKSTNCIDRIDDEIVGGGLKKIKNDAARRMEGLSMPDLNVHKITTLPNSRPKNYRLKSFEALTKAYSESSFWIKPNGPEFIVKSSLPSREIELVESKCQHRRVVSVLLLNGQSLHISCNSLNTTAQQIFEAVIKSENYVENFFIGLCALIGGDFVFLPKDLKIYKVAPQIWVNVSKRTNNIDNVFFTLFLRIKFFLPTLRGISSLESRHMLYLQLRKSVLEKHILCTDDDLIMLGGLALQAEVGDFKESMKYSDYFTISHYLPEGVYQRNKEMAKYLRNSHYCRHGLHPKEAEQNFIKYVQDMKEYGFHLYSAVWTTDESILVDVYVGISLGGIALFERDRQPQANPSTNSKTSYQRKLYMSFEWLEIENLCFSKHILCIVVRKTESLKAKDNNRIKYKLKMDGRKSYFAFSLASEHHQFYMKLRNSFISLKTLSDKLNIPIASTTPTKSSGSGACDEERQFNGVESNSMKGMLENHNNMAVGRQDAEMKPNNGKDDFEADVNRANMANGIGGGGISSGIQENIKKIDKQLKASGLRVRNLKKSMLNDNRLIKLKQRFLRRSKSTVGSCSSNENGSHENDSKKSCKRTEKSNNFPVVEDNDRNNCGRSKEENQNKENECPKVRQLNDLEPKIYSPNRNRVKMGTRVFSTQFLNKSYDNIYDRTLNLYRFESNNSINNDVMENNLEIFKFSGADDGLSVRSASLNSLYCSEKKLNRYSDSPPTNDAYVIHSSIKSEKDINTLYNNFCLPNETISESLMEKFNNISGNNTVTDRIIAKVTVVKERLNKNQNQNQQHNHLSYNSHLNKKNDLISNEPGMRYYGINFGTPANASNNSNIKYATFNQKMAKEYSDCVNNRNVEANNIKENSEYSKALWHLSRSQESIFINNKFPVRNECLAVNQDTTNSSSCSSRSDYNAKVPEGTRHGGGGEANEFTLGISIVQGSDNNVYVKDLVKNGPAEKGGIRIGDQIIAVNGISLLNLSYAESLRLLQNTGLIVELQVSQIFNKNLNSSRHSPTAPTTKSQKDNENLVVSRGSVSSPTTRPNYANNERRNLNSVVTNHCDEYLKRLEREPEEIVKRRKQEARVLLCQDDMNEMKASRQNAEHLVEGIGKRSMKRIGSFEIAGDNIRPTRDKFKSPRNVNGNLCALSPAKSMPDLPKVVAIIPKPDQFAEENNERKRRVARTASQSRKYLGPVRYPVTPIKTILSPIRHQLSLLADSDDEQTYFLSSMYHSLIALQSQIYFLVV